MPQTPHIERDFTAGDSVCDVVSGMSDGLPVPLRSRRRAARPYVALACIPVA